MTRDIRVFGPDVSTGADKMHISRNTLRFIRKILSIVLSKRKIRKRFERFIVFRVLIFFLIQ